MSASAWARAVWRGKERGCESGSVFESRGASSSFSTSSALFGSLMGRCEYLILCRSLVVVMASLSVALLKEVSV